MFYQLQDKTKGVFDIEGCKNGFSCRRSCIVCINGLEYLNGCMEGHTSTPRKKSDKVLICARVCKFFVKLRGVKNFENLFFLINLISKFSN